mgnify:CR=1 FL=1
MGMALVSVLALSIPLNWTTFIIVGVILVGVSVVVLLKGSGPDHSGKSWADGLRWVAWPLTAIWFIIVIVRGLVP